MAFCSYFKIQPVAGGADRIKKSEWKLVSHDNSQPLRERQLLLLLLSPDSTFPCHLRSVTVSLFPPSAYIASSPRSPVPLSLPQRARFSLSSSRSHPFRFLPATPSPRDSSNLSLAQPLLPVLSPTIAIAIINRFKYDDCRYIRRAMRDIDQLCTLAGDINIYANA